MFKNPWFWVSVGLAVILAIFEFGGGRSQDSIPDTPSIAFLVGDADPYWNRVIQGAEEAATKYGADVEVIVPEEGGEDQTRRLLTIDAEKYDGVAISPLRPEEQSRTISVLATHTKVVTFDNDAPESVRHCHVGTNNYVAGTVCGRLMTEALPEGGRIAIFVGDHQRENAILRRQGLVDKLSGVTRTPGSDLDPIDGPIEAGKYTVVATYLDGSVRKKAEENVRRALEEHPDLDGMAALYGYNGPVCLEALEEADKLGQIKLVAFDEDEKLLDAIEAGYAYATVVQAPFQYGYEAIRILTELTQNETAVPYASRGVVYLPCQSVTAENLAEFRSTLGSE